MPRKMQDRIINADTKSTLDVAQFIIISKSVIFEQLPLEYAIAPHFAKLWIAAEYSFTESRGRVHSKSSFKALLG